LDKITPYFRAVVVGGGPSGSAFARSACMNGFTDIAIVDGQKFPRDKACGDGIGPGTVQVLRRLGVDTVLENYTQINYLSVSSPSNIRAQGPLPMVDGAKPEGYTIPRYVFDNHLFKEATAAGAKDYSGFRLEEASFVDGEWTLNLKSSDMGHKIIRTGLLIGADGARSKVRRALGVPQNSDRHTGTAVRMYVESPNGNFKALQIDFTKTLLPAYGWVFPISPTKANIGVGIDLQNFKRRGQKLKSLLENYQDGLPSDMRYDESTYNAFILPYGSELPMLAHPTKNAALIGDAGSMINPLTGEGIFYGMYAGEILGREVASYFKSNEKSSDLTRVLKSYESAFRRKFQSHFNINWEMKEKVESAHWCDIVIRACTRDEKVLSDLIDIMMGDKPDLDFRTILRIISRNLLPF